MKMMSGRVTSCCVVLFLVLTSVSAVQRLNSIKDLKKINFGQSVPKYNLILLHWFANTVDIDNNDNIQLSFDPNSDYGSHHYGNYERLLDTPPRGYRYFTVGNLNQGTSVQLPDYVVHPRQEYVDENRARIIIRVQGQRIDQVYMTQHYETSEYQGTVYDPAHTYQVTTNLLRQIREFSLRDNQLPLLHLRNRFGSNADALSISRTWGSLACLGLLLFIVIEEKYSSNQRNNRPENNSRPENNIRPENQPRRQNNIGRPEHNSRWENYSRPENNIREINGRSENNNRPENNIQEINSTSENCHFCNRYLVGFGFFSILLVVSIIVFLAIYVWSR